MVRYQVFRSVKGVKLLLIPYTATETVCVLVLVKVGSKYEKKELNGIAHFLEHMLFKGTKKRPSPKEIAEVLERVGGVFNGFTSEEYTGYFAKVPKQHLEKAVEWVADIFLNSLIPEKEVIKERKVIIEEINMYNDDPMADVQRLWKKLLYGDQPAGWDIAGTKATVKRIKREDLLKFLQKNYLAQNTLVCIAGNFNSSKTKSLIKKYFQKIKKGKPPKRAKVKEQQKEPQLLLKFKETQQTHLCLGVRAFSMFHPKVYALRLLAGILGGMMSSRLFLEVREKRGLAYYISTNVNTDLDTGYLVTRAGVDNDKTEEAIQVILEEYKKIKRNITQEEIDKAKEYGKGILALSLESSDALATFFGTQLLLKNKIETLEEIYKKIDKVTKDDILKVANQIFVPSKLNLAMIGPHKQRNKFIKLLNQF